MISGNENEAENKKIDPKDTTEIDLELGMNKNMINIYMKKLSNTEAELKKALLIYIYIYISTCIIRELVVMLHFQIEFIKRFLSSFPQQ